MANIEIVRNNRFIHPSYDSFINDQFLDSLVAAAERAHLARTYEALECVAKTLLNHQRTEYIGLYYTAILARNRQTLDSAVIRNFLETVLDDGPDAYRGRALLSLGVSSVQEGNFAEAERYYQEAVCASDDSALQAFATKNLASLHGMQGDHMGAVDKLTRLLVPAYKLGKWYGPFYYDCLNSVAVEVAIIGDRERAAAVLAPVISSPWAARFPEWLATAREIRTEPVAECMKGRPHLLQFPSRQEDPRLGIISKLIDKRPQNQILRIMDGLATNAIKQSSLDLIEQLVTEECLPTSTELNTAKSESAPH